MDIGNPIWNTLNNPAGDAKHKEFGNLVICERCGVFEMMPKDELKGVFDVLVTYQDKFIDEFFGECGLIYKASDGLKALSPDMIKEIREKKENSQEFLAMKSEIPKDKIISAMAKVLEQKSGRKS